MQQRGEAVLVIDSEDESGESVHSIQRYQEEDTGEEEKRQKPMPVVA